jgi:hypothetical protein
MEKQAQLECSNPLKSEHLHEGIKSIIACIDVSDDPHDEKKFGKFEELVFSDNVHNIENVNYSAKPEMLKETNFKNAGEQTYIISTIDDANKFSKTLRNCTGIVVAGQDKETGKDISFMSHEDPETFVQSENGSESFARDLRSRLLEIKERCVPETIDAIIAGGNYFANVYSEKYDKKRRDTYSDSVALLSREIKDAFGFEPVVITGPKAFPGSEHIFYNNAERQLHILRPRTGDETSESYLPKDFAEQEERWAKSPNKLIEENDDE